MPKQLLFNRNEVLQGPSKAVMRVFKDFTPGEAALYFDGYYGSLLAPRIARQFGMPRDRVSVGYVTEFFFRAIFDALRPRKDIVLTHEYHYTFYNYYSKAKNIALRTFRMKDAGDRFLFDVEDC